MDKNDMDRVSGLPDELLVRILSFVPTKVAVSTSILSKRWEFLWMWLPKLEFSSRNNSVPALREFIDKNLPLHRAPVIESLRLFFSLESEDIKRWVEIAVSRYVRELEINYAMRYNRGNIFPSSFFTCTSLVILKLRGVIFVDFPSTIFLPSLKILKLKRVFHEYMNKFPSSFYTCTSLVILILIQVRLMDVPSRVCLPSLKTLKLFEVKHDNYKSLQLLLSICPALKVLSMNVRRLGYDIREFTVIVPSLESLSLFIDTLEVHETTMVEENALSMDYMIDTPLKYFKLKHKTYWVDCSEIKNMPKLTEAYIDASRYIPPGVVIGSVTSVERLTLCSSEIDVHSDGFVFNQLEHLKLCVCNDESSNLLGLLLQNSPNLRVLDIFLMEGHYPTNYHTMGFWNQPSPVPECLLSRLQIFNWSPYSGRPQERDIVVYILKNARHLKKATVLPDTEANDVPNLEELELSSRASNTCELVFVEDHTCS